MSSIQEIVHTYYGNVIDVNITNFEKLLPEKFIFKSPQDQLRSREDFIRVCTPYMEGLSGVNFVKEVYSSEEAFLVLEWVSDDGEKFHSAEYLRISNGSLTEIIIINNNPDFWNNF
ncbi:MAG: hypothetical protein ACW99A_09485 [Candidatus Kariarchaeaceae archaeon]|jgi:hypothetical protein